jgi:hypothetical protein
MRKHTRALFLVAAAGAVAAVALPRRMPARESIAAVRRLPRRRWSAAPVAGSCSGQRRRGRWSSYTADDFPALG